MAIIDALKWIISADGAGFRRELDRNDKALKKSNKQLTSDFKTLGNDIKGLRNQVLAFVGVGGLLSFSNSTLKTADDVGKLAKQLGTTAEELSTLTFAADLSGASQDDLRLALRRTSRGIDQAEQGTGTYGKMLQELGIATRDANGEMRSSTDVLKDIADLFQTLPDGPTKTALAFELLGDNGQRLIPLMNEGSAGMAKLQERARELGLEISTKAAEDAAYFNDQLTELKGSVQGLGNSILLDALPHLNEMTNAIKTAYQESGLLTSAWVALGGLGDALFNPSAATKLKRLRNELADAEEELRKFQETGRKGMGLAALVQAERLPGKIERLKAEIAELEAEQAKIDAAAQKRSEEQRRRDEEARKAKQKELEDLQKQRDANLAAAKAEEERKRAAEAAAKEAQARIQKGEAAVASLEREIALFEKASTVAQVKYDIERGAYADLSEAHQQRLIEYAKELDALENAKRAKEEADRAAKAAADEESRIRQQLFDQTRTEAEAREIELARLSDLYQRGVIDLQVYERAVDQVNNKVDQMSVFADEAARNMQSAFADFLFDPFDQGVKGMLRGFVDTLRRMVAELLASQLLTSAFTSLAGGAAPGSGGVAGFFATMAAGFADGGPVVGPGTGTSDSIPARLSNGEFVQPAASTSYYGADFMEALRRRSIPSRIAQNLMADVQRHSPRIPQMPRFAEGGMAQGGGAGAAPGSLNLVLVDDRANIGDYMTSPDGQKAQLVNIQRNAKAIKRMLDGAGS